VKMLYDSMKCLQARLFRQYGKFVAVNYGQMMKCQDTENHINWIREVMNVNLSTKLGNKWLFLDTPFVLKQAVALYFTSYISLRMASLLSRTRCFKFVFYIFSKFQYGKSSNPVETLLFRDFRI
jgi:hypothetical protein